MHVRCCGTCCDICARDVKPPRMASSSACERRCSERRCSERRCSGRSRAVAHSKQMRRFTSAGAAASHAAPRSFDNTTSDAQRMMTMMICAAVKVCRLQHITCAHAYSPAPSRGSSSKCTCQIVTKTDGGKLCKLSQKPTVRRYTHALGLELAPGEGAHAA